MRSLAVLGLALVALLAGAGGAVGSSAALPGHSIVVTGSGAVATTPDRAQLSLGVSSDARSASAALRANAADMTKVIAAVKAQGIAAADIQTQLVSLSPRSRQNGEGIAGYTAANSVTVTLRVPAKAGRAIDAAVDVGANQISGPDLSRGDQNALYRAALRAAVSNARAKAQAIAEASGLTLRRITDVTESIAAPPLPLTDAKTGVATPTPVEPGTQLVEASVTVTFSVGW
jgi:uncharacterized protein YggE